MWLARLCMLFSFFNFALTASHWSCDLQALSSAGDCRFYDCAEGIVNCQKRGFSTLTSLGKHLCTSFEKQHLFTPQGRLWSENSLKCSQQTLLNHLRTRAKSCASIQEVILESHHICFIQSEPGFCTILQDSRNRDALVNVYGDLASGHERNFLIRQVKEIAASCVDRNLNLVIDFEHDDATRIQSIKRSMIQAVESLSRTLPRSSQESQSAVEDVNPQCLNSSRAGDCDFYECFHRRFPCDPSHVIEYEVISCKRFEMSAQSSNELLRMTKYYSNCLMQSLLTLYQSNSIQCSQIENILHATRRQCLYDAGLCDVTNVNLFLEGATDLGGYPVKIPFLYNGPRQPVEVTYFRQTSLFRGQIADVLCRCRSQHGLCQPKYGVTITGDIRHLFENSRNNAKIDIKCRNAGGSCQEQGRQCNRSYVTGLCKGSSTYQCCLSGGDN